jgi:hypothetical protein
MRFEVLLATNMKMAVFWVVASCNLIDIDRRFRGDHGLTIKVMVERVPLKRPSVFDARTQKTAIFRI